MANNLTGPSGETRMGDVGEPVSNVWLERAENGGQPSPASGSKLGQYLSLVWRRKWLILVLTALGARGRHAATRSITPTYSTTATIWIHQQGRNASERGPIRSEELLESYAWIDLLRSQAVLEHVVRSRRLYLGAPLRADYSALEG